MEVDTELRLVERLQAGDVTAIEGLMERYSSRLYRLAYGITRCSRDAEEVLQDVFLFSGTVRDNVAFGNRTRAGGEVERALDEVGGARLVARLPHGLDEEVGERGAYLSMGERQILAFARALHYDPSILILDEATSSVDVETEREIQAALHRLLQGRTSLVIAHRLSTILDADRILVMHKGELREQGTHAELLAQGGIYARLYELQYRRQVVSEAQTSAIGASEAAST